jgi:DNA-binding NarL/FixJ family response regulator
MSWISIHQQPLCAPHSRAPAGSAHAFLEAHGPSAGTVLVADDHELLRVGIRAVLQAARPGVQVLEAASLGEAIDIYREAGQIDLVLLDLNMSDCRGLQGLRQFKQSFPDALVAVLSATQDEFVVRQAQALGAAAYVAKASKPAAMAELILSLLDFGTAHDHGAGIAPAGFPASAHSARFERVAALGPRHLEVLDLLLFGCSNQEISSATGLSLGTVKNYVSTILLALDVKSRSHLISLFG